MGAVNNSNDDSVNFLEFLKYLVNKIWLVIILMVMGGSLAFCLSKFYMPLKYKSSISMYVKSGSKTVVDSIQQGELSVARSLVATYIVVLQSDTVMEQVGDELIKKYPVDEISKCLTVNMQEDGEAKISPSSIKDTLSMESVNSTEVLRVTSETTDAEISASICNIIAEKAQTVLVRVVGAGSVEVIGPAKASKTSSSPNIPKITFLGTFAGALLASMIIFLIYFFDNTIKSSEDIEKRFKKPVLGEVQALSSGKKSNMRKTILDNDITFAVKESYKSMRTNIIFSLAASNKKIILISSANMGDGKSTTAANIAISFAQTGKKILLMDADLRKPVQQKIFGLNNNKGLSGIIGNISSFEESVHKNVYENLDILTSGERPPNPSELLGSANTSELLKGLSKLYDYIIIDTPPVNVVSDAVNINSDMSGMIFVVKHVSTTIDDVSRAIKTAELANADLLGIVINDIQVKEVLGYSQKYKYNYDGYDK